jgi:hypothetical protein
LNLPKAAFPCGKAAGKIGVTGKKLLIVVAPLDISPVVAM